MGNDAGTGTGTALSTNGLPRRGLLTAGLAGMAGLALASPAAATPTWRSLHPFQLGVASGDPTSSGVVLWTRLAIEPLAADGLGGMPAQNIPVQWELALDERFSRIERRGTVVASPAAAHSVHVELEGLPAGAEFYYRFRTGAHVSQVGRTLTMPGSGVTRPLNFVSVSCSHYEGGYFTAYAHAAEERPDVVFALGDYIYEGAGVAGRTRVHPGSTCVTLADYRRRYALYKAEPELQLLHQAAPWVVTWDDHEVQDNWAGLYPKNGVPTEAWMARRAGATQAYYENMPLRRSSAPSGSSMQLYRRFQWGDLAAMHVLDTRQYRDLQACHDGGRTWWFSDCADQSDPSRSILGHEQEQWLLGGLSRSKAPWQVLAQSVFFAKRDITAGSVTSLGSDGWDGYRADRDAVRDAWARNGQNGVVLTGDVHLHFANEILADFEDPSSRPVGVELVTTSVTSGGNGSTTVNGGPTVLAENPHIKYIANRRGYVSATIDASELRSRFMTMPYVTERGAGISVHREYVTPVGTSRLLPA